MLVKLKLVLIGIAKYQEHKAILARELLRIVSKNKA
jgi:hypothetical protein